MMNVLDYGLIGDGVADDTSALQALVATAPARARLYFPLGHYKLTAGIDSAGKSLSFIGDGSGPPNMGYGGGTALVGNVAGPLLRFAYPAQDVTIADISISNPHAAGTGLELSGIRLAVERVSVCAYRAIRAMPNTFTLGIRSARTVWVGQTAGSVGITLSGHASIHSADVVGAEHGVRACGNGNDIRNLRAEVNKVGLMLGQDHNGSVFALASTIVEAISLEANDVGIHARSVAACRLGGVTCQGSIGSPSGGSKVGLWAESMQFSEVGPCSLVGGYSEAAVRITPSLGTQRWVNVNAQNTNPSGKVWDVVSLRNLTLEQCS